MDPIVAKIAKLLALAKGRGTTPHEAAAAAARAQELLLEHELTMEQVEGATPSAYGEERRRILSSSRYRATWESVLIRAIAEHCLCVAIRLEASRDCVLIGKAHHIAVAVYLYAYLQREIIRLARLGAPKTRRRTIAEKWQREFALGAIDEVALRLDQQRMAACGEVTALVLRSSAALDQEVARRYPRLQAGRRVSLRIPRAYFQGRLAGRGIPLQHPIDPGSAQPVRALVGA